MAATVAVTETAVVTMGRYRRDTMVVTAAAVATGGSRKQFGVTTAGTDKNQPSIRGNIGGGSSGADNRERERDRDGECVGDGKVEDGGGDGGNDGGGGCS